MSAAMWGALLGLTASTGLVMVAATLADLRRPRLADRVLPYVRDLPGVDVRDLPSGRRYAGLRLVLGRAAEGLGQVLGGSASVARRLDRANLPLTVQDFRVEQVLWGLVGFAATAAFSLLVAMRSPERTVPLLVLCGVAFVLGALLRENRLTAEANGRDRRMLEEFPAVAELIALSVAAGEGPVAALERVTARSRGELAAELARVLADVRTGTPVAVALEAMASRSGLPVLSRFAEGLAVAIERGTPLAEVLHAQAADVREAGRRALIESGARREVLMMVPVVFLVLPVTVLFAFWPGVVGLRLVTP